MGTIKVVTTFNASGFELYGRKMIRTFRENWEVPLTVYQEGFQIDGGIDLNVPWQQQFKERNKGRTFQDFRFDAVRFSHKIAAVTDAAKDCNYLIWVDGDVFTYKPVTMDVLKQWLPDDGQYLSWLWRQKNYPEMGFYVLNCKHPAHQQIMQSLIEYYNTDKIYELEQYHDCWVFRKVVIDAGVAWKSLSGVYETHLHPFVNSDLGRFMDHAKGNRKLKGHSHQSDYVR